MLFSSVFYKQKRMPGSWNTNCQYYAKTFFDQITHS